MNVIAEIISHWPLAAREAIRVMKDSVEELAKMQRYIGDLEAEIRVLRATDKNTDFAALYREVQAELSTPCYCCRESGCQSGCRCHSLDAQEAPQT